MTNQIITVITQKRLVGDQRILQKEPLEFIDSYPDEKDMLVWYFLLRGPEATDYKGGYYIGKVMHNPEYPIKGPDYMMLTPSGRFDIEKKICLTNSGYHSESWSSAWNIKTILLGFLSIMLDDSTSGISHIKRSPEERKMLAENSISYNMMYHKDKWIKFERFVKPDGCVKSNDEIKELLALEKSKNTKNQPAEQKPAEQKPAEQKPAEKADQKAGEQKAGEQMAGEQKAAEQKAAEQKAGEQKAAEQKAAEQKGKQKRKQKGEQKDKVDQKDKAKIRKPRTILVKQKKVPTKAPAEAPAPVEALIKPTAKATAKTPAKVVVKATAKQKILAEAPEKVPAKRGRKPKNTKIIVDIDTFNPDECKLDVKETDNEYNKLRLHLAANKIEK
jgi:ubiquitin-conjugating enzyme E2 J2